MGKQRRITVGDRGGSPLAVDPVEHTRLAWWAARREWRPGDHFGDLVGVAAVELMHACRRFRASEGCKFSTYAFRCMVGGIRGWRQGERRFRCRSFRVGRRRERTVTRHVILFSEFGRDFVRGKNPVFAVVEPQGECAVERGEDKARIAEWLRSLSDHAATVIRLRFGIDTNVHTLNEVAIELGITRERVRQIETKALLKMGEIANST